MTESVELMVDAKAALGEGPIWHAQKQALYWVNILENQLHIYNPTTNEDRSIDVGQYVTTVVPRKSEGLIVTVQDGFASLDPETEQLTIIHDPERHLPGNRFNDGKCDPAGRLWAGTMSLGSGITGAGSLYVMDRDLSVRRVLDRVTISNGIAWSLDHLMMYYIDTPTREVSAFDYDIESGSISNRRTAVKIPETYGFPDGMTIDAEGMLWVAGWGSSRVSRWDPKSGKLLQAVTIPATNVSACAFGGHNLDDLYITTAREGLTEEDLVEQPLAGGLFRVKPGVCGNETFEFAG